MPDLPKKVKLVSPRSNGRGFCLQESDEAGKFLEIVRDEWTVFLQSSDFTIENLRYSIGCIGKQATVKFDDNLNHSANITERSKPENWELTVANNGTLSGDLVPQKIGRWRASSPPRYSLFGSSDIVKSFGLEISKIESDECESATLSGFLRDQYEANEYGPKTQQEDSIHVVLKLSPNNFDQLLNNFNEGKNRTYHFSLQGASGFYTNREYDNIASDIKILTSGFDWGDEENDPHSVQMPENCDVKPLRLGYVSEFRFNMYKPLAVDYKKQFTKNTRTESALRPEQAIFLGRQQSGLERFEIAKVLIPLCVEEAIRLGDSEKELEHRFELVLHILTTIEDASENRSGFFEDVKSEEEIEKITQNKYRSIWTRKNPQIAFNEGTESESYFDNDYEVRSMAANYLQNPFLQSPTLDWVILDILATGELCQFGEAAKKTPLGHKSDEYGRHYRYEEMNGNLLKMNKFDWGAFTETVLTKIGILVLPILLIIALFEIEWQITAYIATSLYFVSMACYLVFKTFRGAKTFFRFLTGQPNPLYKPLYLWEKMYKVWFTLEGDIVNPKNIRNAMEESAVDGAVWDQSMWGIIDRAIASNPAGIIINKKHLKYKKYD